MLAVHIGAWDIPPKERAAHAQGALAAVEAGWRCLQDGGTAERAVIDAVMQMEDDPTLNAGHGSVLCREGWVELDAALMTGERLEVGAVACVRDVPNPIKLAAALHDEPEVLLVGEGASRLARRHGIPTCPPSALVVSRERSRLHAWRERHPADTVGAVALDLRGKLAAGTSTGGRPGKPSGRVGDAPIPGAGLWADDTCGAAVATGWGEEILRFSLARRVAELGREHPAEDACWIAMRDFEARLQGRGGVLLVARDGSLGWGFSTPRMGIAWMAGDMDAPEVVGLA